MCGACGRTVTADEVLGPVRTQRQHFIVATILNALCKGLPGVPSVQAAGDSWLLRGPTGAVTRCATVADLWGAVAAACAAAGRAACSGAARGCRPAPGGDRCGPCPAFPQTLIPADPDSC